MTQIKEKIITFKNRLLTINDEEPLSKLSLFVIIALDIFILFVVFQGLDDHTQQLTSPYEYCPYQCREVLIKQKWTEASRMAKLQKLVLSDYNNYSYRYNSQFEKSRIERMHPICKQFFLKINAIAKDKDLLKLFKKHQKIIEEKRQFTSKFKQAKDVYDTSLLENIAEQNADKTTLPSIASSMKYKAQQIEGFNLQISNIEKKINAHNLVKDLWDFIASIDTSQRDQLKKDIRKFAFWYPLKELAWQFLFLLPLFAIFYVWNIRSVKKDNKLQVLISSHLIVIASIPILFRIIDVVLELIPRHFFKNLFKLLKSLHIIALWHYVLIVASILFALFAIYIIQKKIFNKRRLQLKRLMKGACYHCGKKLPDGSTACPFCGVMQYKSCSGCESNTFVGGDYCISCGKSVTTLSP